MNRTATLLHKNVGSIPSLEGATDADRAVLAQSEAAFTTVGDLIGAQRQRAAISEAMRVVGEANKYLADTAPWKLKTEDPARMETVLGVAAQARGRRQHHAGALPAAQARRRCMRHWAAPTSSRPCLR
ncbi:hypothetical protein GCM10025876_12520 [Demequina litorisediminis]|uniref:Uncharacterized protein n=1 Tax=Demequina litorisediminis TaxID=1849022 RepID=A0ABQ6IB22_9MICO|nr:hypothetical protein GCM10025876_12520 [Demequina litorisediminis]